MPNKHLKLLVSSLELQNGSTKVKLTKNHFLILYCLFKAGTGNLVLYKDIPVKTSSVKVNVCEMDVPADLIGNDYSRGYYLTDSYQYKIVY